MLQITVFKYHRAADDSGQQHECTTTIEIYFAQVINHHPDASLRPEGSTPIHLVFPHLPLSLTLVFALLNGALTTRLK